MNSFIAWIGGKKLLRNQILELFPTEMNRYVEVFGGAGWVLFQKDIKSSKVEVFNDLDSELINLYKQIKHHPEALQNELDFHLVSREMFFNYRDMSLKNMTEIQRAARYFYLIKASFGAKKLSFDIKKKNLVKSTEYFTEIHKRLREVVVENKSFDDMILKYDRVDTLFYLDPPYHTTEKYYGDKFADCDHIRLCELLKNIKGRFILSYNNDDFIKDLYKDFTIIEVSRNNNLKGDGSQFKEVIIKNF